MRTRNFLSLAFSLLSFWLTTDAIAIPPEKIVRSSGSIKVEVKQLSVVVDGEPDGLPTGWKGFEEYSGLAFVKFEVRIFQNGYLKGLEMLGPYSYRGGDLPELVEIRNLDQDSDLEVVIHFRDYTGEAKHRNLYIHIYDWQPNKKRYQAVTRIAYANMDPSTVEPKFRLLQAINFQYSRCDKSDNYCYQIGNYGPAVGRIIELLIRKGYYQGNNDQTFGSATQTAIQDFQSNLGLTSDGIAGPSTIDELCVPNEIYSPRISQNRREQLGRVYRVCRTGLLSFPETLE